MSNTLPDELVALGPYHHDIEVAPGVFTNPQTRRVRNACELFFPTLLRLCGGSLTGLRVLDVGCNCGGFSFLASSFGASEVVGIDSREIHIQQARAIALALGRSNLRFEVMAAEDVDQSVLGEFDVTLLFGILYHLRDPIGVMRRLSGVTRYLAALDCHVHYSADANIEDYPMWWMLRDTDSGIPDGLFDGDERDTVGAWSRFEREVAVNYSSMPNQFVGSPHSQRDQAFAQLINPEPTNDCVAPESVYGREPGQLVLVPNRRALIDLVRDSGFEDVLDIIPHRFSELRYLRRYRVGLMALKRDEGGVFRSSMRRRLQGDTRG